MDTYAAPILNWPPSAKNDISALLLTHDLKANSFVKLLCVITLVMGFNMIPLIVVLLGNDYVDHKRCFPNIGTSKAIDIVYMCCMKNYPTVDFTCVLQATTVEEMKLLLPVSSFVNIPVKQMSLYFGNAVCTCMKTKTQSIDVYVNAYEDAIIAFDLSTVCSPTNTAEPLGCYPFPSNTYKLKLEHTEDGHSYAKLLNQVNVEHFNVEAIETKTCLNLFQSINIVEWKQGGYYDINTFTAIPRTLSLLEAVPTLISIPLQDGIPDDAVIRSSTGAQLTTILKSWGLTHTGSVAELKHKALSAAKFARAYGLTQESFLPTVQEQQELYEIVKKGYARMNDPMENFQVCTELSPTLREDVIDTYMLKTSTCTSSTSMSSRVIDNGATRFATNINESIFHLLDKNGKEWLRLQKCPSSKNCGHVCSINCLKIVKGLYDNMPNNSGVAAEELESIIVDEGAMPIGTENLQYVRQILKAQIQRSNIDNLRNTIASVLVNVYSNTIDAIEDVHCLPKPGLFNIHGEIDAAKKSNVDYKPCRHGLHGRCSHCVALIIFKSEGGCHGSATTENTWLAPAPTKRSTAPELPKNQKPYVPFFADGKGRSTANSIRPEKIDQIMNGLTDIKNLKALLLFCKASKEERASLYQGKSPKNNLAVRNLNVEIYDFAGRLQVLQKVRTSGAAPTAVPNRDAAGDAVVVDAAAGTAVHTESRGSVHLINGCRC